MGKFGIGARVRDEDGDEGVIVGKRKGERLVRYGADLRGIEVWVTKSFLTPIAPAEKRQGETPASEPEWQPKVGQRVRFTDKCQGYWWFGPQEKYKVGTVLKIDGSHRYLPIHVMCSNGDTAYVGADHIEPLPVDEETQGEGLTIVAGRYYRTRDGRKVGPAQEYPHKSEFYPDCTWIVDEVLYQDDGTFADGYCPEHDLVSEWSVPKPVAVAPATATPSFKVGDHIRVKDGTLTGTIATRSPGGAMSFVTDGEDVAGPEFWFDDELELADRTFKPGTFANLRVKVTSINGQKANVIIPGLRNPSHGVSLSELSA